MPASEQNIHTAIHVFLKLALPEDAVEFAVDSAGKVSREVAIKLKARGGKRGIPDHFVIWRGKTIGLEVKKITGRAQPEQIEMAAKFRRAGASYYLVRGVADAETALRGEGVPLRATTLTAQERDARLAARPPSKQQRAPQRRSLLGGFDEPTPFDGPELL